MFVLIGVALIALAIALMKLFHLKTIPIIAIIVRCSSRRCRPALQVC